MEEAKVVFRLLTNASVIFLVCIYWGRVNSWV